MPCFFQFSRSWSFTHPRWCWNPSCLWWFPWLKSVFGGTFQKHIKYWARFLQGEFWWVSHWHISCMIWAIVLAFITCISHEGDGQFVDMMYHWQYDWFCQESTSTAACWLSATSSVHLARERRGITYRIEKASWPDCCKVCLCVCLYVPLSVSHSVSLANAWEYILQEAKLSLG